MNENFYIFGKNVVCYGNIPLIKHFTFILTVSIILKTTFEHRRYSLVTLGSYQVYLRLRRLAPVVPGAGEPGAAHPVPVLLAPAHGPGPPETHRATWPHHGAPGAAVLADQRPVAPDHAGARRGDRGPRHGQREAGEEEGG